MKRLIIKLILFVGMTLALGGCFNAAEDGVEPTQFVITKEFESRYINAPIEYRLDKQYGIKSPQDLSENTQWQSLEGAVSFLFEDKLGWIKFPILNKSANEKWILELDWPKALFVSVDMFYKADTATEYIKIKRNHRHRFFTWQLELKQFESGSVIFRADAPERLALPIRIYKADRYAIETVYITAGISFFISIILALGVFNLFIGVRTKDETHLWYCLGQFALGWFFAFYYGLDHKLYPGVPDEIILIGVWVVGYMSLIGLTFFIISYMDFRVKYPRLYPFIMAGSFSLFVTIGFYGVVDSRLVATLYFIQMGALLNAILLTALYGAVKGDRLALYFMLIWVSVSMFLAVFNSQMLGLIERTLISNHALLFAFALEALLFSFALGERINSLIKENYEAETSARVKSDFLAQMSHEIRTPMNAIIGMSQLMGLTALEKKQQLYNNLVQSSAESLLCIINDILDFSKIEAGKLSLENISFSLSELVQGVLGIFYSHVKRTGIPLYCSIQPLVPDELMGDPSRLRQILINLVGNAFKFTSEGYILLTVSVDPLVPGQVKFSVRDSGVGISDHAKRRLFSAFAQVDASTSRKYGGTGLGLAISKKLSMLMGGEIGVESKEGVGSCFFFTACLLKRMNEGNGEDYLLRRSEGLFDFSSSVRMIVVWSRPEFCDLLATHFICYNIRVLRCSSRQQLSSLVKRHDGQLLGVIIDEALQRLEQLKLLGVLPLLENEGDSGDNQVLQKSVPKWLVLTGDIEDRPIDGVRQGFEMCRWGIVNRFYEELVSGKEETDDKGLPSYHTICSGLRVLVAEDMLTNQEVIRGFMAQLGHEITVVDNGIRAVQDYQQHGEDYDLILMDCSMPEMDGFEATRMIRNFEKGHEKPPALIVALTAQAFSEHRQQCIDSGMDDHLSKPITLRNLISTLNRHFPGEGRPD